MERSEIRGCFVARATNPVCAALHPGYLLLFQTRQVDEFLHDRADVHDERLDVASLSDVAPTVCGLVAHVFQLRQSLFRIAAEIPRCLGATGSV